jgi:cathepsin C
MISSRVRIMTKNRQKPIYPYDQILSCDRYNQGCAGGYPYLVEKYTQDFGLTTSGKCAKSTESLEKMRQELGEGAKVGDHEVAVRVKKFGYIGGYYGGTKTSQMMKELYTNGPIVVGINGGYELMHYAEGLFIETGEGETLDNSGLKQKGIKNDFERVDHAVMVVGWAVENGKKHWIIKNSYGANWGEKGYFRIPLGGDADGITSLTSAGMPVLGNSEYFNAEEAKEEAEEAKMATLE